MEFGGTRITTFRLASKRDWEALKRDVKPICTAVNADAARAALDELTGTWGQRSASTWSPGPWTRPGPAEPGGQCGGSPH
jgi:hypothetical protein